MAERHSSIKVGLRIREALYGIMAQGFSGVFRRGFDLNEVVDNYLSYEKASANIAAVERASGMPLNGKRVLEVGSGVGMNLVAAEKEFGAAAFGVEPSAGEFKDFYRISLEIAEAYACKNVEIAAGEGEALPYPDEAFDAVFSFNVLEHTRDPRKVIEEAVRVLKKGGALYFSFPSYGTFWEGHYKLIWLPFLTKALAKVYVRIFGRESGYIEHLQFLTHKKVLKIVSSLGNVDLLTTGREIWRGKMLKLEGLRWVHSRVFVSAITLCHKMRLSKAVISLDKVFNFYTPIVLVLRKRARCADGS